MIMIMNEPHSLSLFSLLSPFSFLLLETMSFFIFLFFPRSPLSLFSLFLCYLISHAWTPLCISCAGPLWCTAGPRLTVVSRLGRSAFNRPNPPVSSDTANVHPETLERTIRLRSKVACHWGRCCCWCADVLRWDALQCPLYFSLA